jgi:toxin ParE1/3/4
MRVILTPEAQEDFERIGDYISQFNPVRAQTFIDEITLRCLKLADMPLRHQLFPGHEESGVRRMPHGRYVVFYGVIVDTVYVLHILNAAQDHEAILFADDAPGR